MQSLMKASVRADRFWDQAWNIMTGQSIPSVMFFSTFATSVWIWLYAGSLVLARALAMTERGLDFIGRLDVRSKPFGVLARLASAASFTLVLLIYGLSAGWSFVSDAEEPAKKTVTRKRDCWAEYPACTKECRTKHVADGEKELLCIELCEAAAFWCKYPER